MHFHAICRGCQLLKLLQLYAASMPLRNHHHTIAVGCANCINLVIFVIFQLAICPSFQKTLSKQNHMSYYRPQNEVRHGLRLFTPPPSTLQFENDGLQSVFHVTAASELHVGLDFTCSTNIILRLSCLAKCTLLRVENIIRNISAIPNKFSLPRLKICLQQLVYLYRTESETKC